MKKRKKLIVLSLGGSLIVPDKVDYVFLKKFKKILFKLNKKLGYKFVVVCGGGAIARDYISALKKAKRSKKQLGLAGMAATRLNAKLLMDIFGGEANDTIPKDMIEVKNLLKKNDFVFCGALRFAKNETSDGTATKLAHFLNTNFINITNVRGVYTKNPYTNKNAKFIPEITWKKFDTIVSKIKYKAGQHFVLDQNASKIIMKNKIKTYIIGKNLNNIGRILKGKKFEGTIIYG